MASYFQDILNKDMFQTPVDIGRPENRDDSFPNEALGTPDQKDAEPVNDPENRVEEDTDPAPDDGATTTANIDYDEALPDPEGSPSQDFIIKRGLPEGYDSPTWDDTSRPVQDPAPDPHFQRYSEEATRMPMPAKMVEATKQIADDIMRRLMISMFGDPKTAVAEIARMESSGAMESAILQNIKKHLVEYAKELGIEKEIAAMAAPKKPQSAADINGNNGPLDPFSFPATAPPSPGSTFTPPGKGPAAQTETERENDSQVFPKNDSAPDFHPPGDKTGTPGGGGDTAHTEQEQQTFPKAGDLNLKVPLGNQPPETLRHNPDMKHESECKAGMSPKAPWESRMASGFEGQPTPGLEFLYKSDDGHVRTVEQTAQEVDLFHRRYAKRNDIKDLQQQSERFLAERAAMGCMAECPGHIDIQRSYAKECFAFSYGQMKRSVNRAIRNFADTDEVPEMEQYHSLLQMRADLLGEASTKHFAQAKLPVAIASFVAAEEPDEDDKPFPPKKDDKEKSMEDAGRSPGDPNKKDEKGDKEMTKEDMKAGLDIAAQLVQAGLVATEKYSETAVTLAEMDPKTRATWAAMANNVGSEEPTSAAELPSQATSLAAAEINLVPSGVRNTAGSASRSEQASKRPGSLFAFMNNRRSPIHGG